jgi:hypothetical protein
VTNEQCLDVARNFATDILKREPHRTPERMDEIAAMAANMASNVYSGVVIDVNRLKVELRHMFSVEIDAATILDDHDPVAHVEWLTQRRGEIKWRFWQRYMTYLERDFGMPPSVVNSVDELTNKILGRLEEPSRQGPWDRRGMVVGSVQSGKTANYIGLIGKAVDVGYKLVIVLAGIHSNLRAQTQLRIDEGVLGFDTQKSRRLNDDSRWVGVGTHGEKLHIHSLTSSAEDGDFNKRVADNIGVMLGGDPVVLVVKKNAYLLKNLLNWVKGVAGIDIPGTKEKIIRNVPLLLIDDEADNASINTNNKSIPVDTALATSGNEPTAINARIRGILQAFEKSAYVGYTATPFANIFINPSAQHEKLGDDIFPRSFIINVKPPSNYVGPVKVFGLQGDTDSDIPAEQGLSITRSITDFDGPKMFPPKHKKDHKPTELPDSLQRAIRCFVLVCAARRSRGQVRVHNSMLVHVTRFVDVQSEVVTLVNDELLPLQRRLQFGDGARRPTVHEELQALWEQEFVPVTSEFPEYTSPTWADIERELHPAAAKITVKPINGLAGEALDYKENEKDGLSVIAVGGDKLSRGLTLEGLSVSYFLRTSQMYDTLMQMGRWFGYRSGYLDLCRLYTTHQLLTWYRHIALTDVELRREFDYMVAANRTPKDYGLRVRTHPDGMLITAVNKMCHSQTLQLSWAGVLVQTHQLPLDERIAENVTHTESLLVPLGPPLHRAVDDCNRTWTNVPHDRVAAYVQALRLPAHSSQASGKQIADFIRLQANKAPAELTTWTVVLVSTQNGWKGKVGSFNVGFVKRNPPSPPLEGAVEFALRNANLISPSNQSLDLFELPVGDYLDALRETKEIPELDADIPAEITTLHELSLHITKERAKHDPRPRKRKDGVSLDPETIQIPNGRVVREVRPSTHGLLLIYPLLNPRRIKGRDSDDDAPELDTAEDPGQPVMGVALSFPSSKTATTVEYQVNRVWNAEIEDDSLYDD